MAKKTLSPSLSVKLTGHLEDIYQDIKDLNTQGHALPIDDIREKLENFMAKLPSHAQVLVHLSLGGTPPKLPKYHTHEFHSYPHTSGQKLFCAFGALVNTYQNRKKKKILEENDNGESGSSGESTASESALVQEQILNGLTHEEREKIQAFIAQLEGNLEELDEENLPPEIAAILEKIRKENPSVEQETDLLTQLLMHKPEEQEVEKETSNEEKEEEKNGKKEKEEKKNKEKEEQKQEKEPEQEEFQKDLDEKEKFSEEEEIQKQKTLKSETQLEQEQQEERPEKGDIKKIEKEIAQQEPEPEPEVTPILEQQPEKPERKTETTENEKVQGKDQQNFPTVEPLLPEQNESLEEESLEEKLEELEPDTQEKPEKTSKDPDSKTEKKKITWMEVRTFIRGKKSSLNSAATVEKFYQNNRQDLNAFGFKSWEELRSFLRYGGNGREFIRELMDAGLLLPDKELADMIEKAEKNPKNLKEGIEKNHQRDFEKNKEEQDQKKDMGSAATAMAKQQKEDRLKKLEGIIGRAISQHADWYASHNEAEILNWIASNLNGYTMSDIRTVMAQNARISTAIRSRSAPERTLPVSQKQQKEKEEQRRKQAQAKQKAEQENEKSKEHERTAAQTATVATLAAAEKKKEEAKAKVEKQKAEEEKLKQQQKNEALEREKEQKKKQQLLQQQAKDSAKNSNEKKEKSDKGNDDLENKSLFWGDEPDKDKGENSLFGPPQGDEPKKEDNPFFPQKNVDDENTVQQEQHPEEEAELRLIAAIISANIKEHKEWYLRHSPEQLTIELSDLLGTEGITPEKIKRSMTYLPKEDLMVFYTLDEELARNHEIEKAARLQQADPGMERD